MSLHTLTGVRSAAFPGTADAEVLVYVPPGYDAARPAVFLYLHGLGNCIYNAARDEGPCPHGVSDHTAHLMSQLDAAGRSAALVLPEVRRHARSSDPGAFAEPGALGALLDEILGQLGGELGAAEVGALERVVLASHSGGYKAAAGLVLDGGVPVQELYLLDSLYGMEDEFDRYLAQDLAAYAAGGRRLVNLYGESTAERSQAQGRRLRRMLRGAGLDEALLQGDDQAGHPGEAQLGRGLLVQRVATAHSDIPRTYVEALLRSSALPLAR